jgi:hypothetical protein
MATDELSGALARLMLLRLNVLPPYTSDEDEGEKDEDDYLAFYQGGVRRSIEALSKYIRSITALGESKNRHSRVQAYLRARRELLATLPFVTDEFPEDNADAYPAFFDCLSSHLVDRAEPLFGDRDLTALRDYLASLHEIELILARRG